jgi:hypothetical protein
VGCLLSWARRTKGYGVCPKFWEFANPRKKKGKKERDRSEKKSETKAERKGGKGSSNVFKLEFDSKQI